MDKHISHTVETLEYRHSVFLDFIPGIQFSQTSFHQKHLLKALHRTYIYTWDSVTIITLPPFQPVNWDWVTLFLSHLFNLSIPRTLPVATTSTCTVTQSHMLTNTTCPFIYMYMYRAVTDEAKWLLLSFHLSIYSKLHVCTFPHITYMYIHVFCMLYATQHKCMYVHST